MWGRPALRSGVRRWQKAVWARNKASLLHGPLPHQGGTLSHSYEVWPPLTIKSPFYSLRFLFSFFSETRKGEWITHRQSGRWQERHLKTHDPPVRYWYGLSLESNIFYSSVQETRRLRRDFFRGRGISVEPLRQAHRATPRRDRGYDRFRFFY